MRSPARINDSGAIVGTATYTPPTLPPGQSPPANQPAAGSHGVMLLPADFAPSVLKVNSSFNEQKINSTTGYAQPDNYDEDLKIAAGHTNAGKITVTNLHQNFFGVKPGTMPNSFFAGDTVTIKKLDNTDPETNQTERGTIRLYAIQNLGQSGEQSYPIPISNSGQTLPNSAVPFTTSISTDQPANLVSVLYSDSAAIPQGSNVTYYMERVDPGPITLEYRIHFGSGNTPDMVMTQNFTVCTQQSKTAWEADIRQEILLQTGVDMGSYTYTDYMASPFISDKSYIQATYAYYQELFTQKSSLFGWAGLAKLAGSDIYGAMCDSEYGRTTLPPWLSVGGYSVGNALADFVQNTLTKGNYEIFDDLAWQFRAYQASGIGALRYTSSNGLDTPSILSMDISPWNELYQGDYSSTPSLVQDAMLQILQREQEYIAQRSWDIFHANSYYVGDTLLSVLTQSPLPSGASFLTVMGSSADVTVYSDRWGWITNSSHGMWPQWNGYSNSAQVGFAGISLRVYSEGYSLFYDYSQTSYPIIW